MDLVLEYFSTQAEKNRQVNEDLKQPFFIEFKKMVLMGYFSSADIIYNYLEYAPVPGRLDGCIPLSSDQNLVVGNHF
jgi:hypothetical protein